MADRRVFTVQRGSVHRVLIAAASGEDITDITITVDLHRLPGGRNSYTPIPDVAASYTMIAFDGDDDRGEGWYAELDEAETADLKPGIYLAVPTVTAGGEILNLEVPDLWLLEIVGS